MKQLSNCDLSNFHSFGFSSISPKVFQPSTLAELEVALTEIDHPFYILGEGTNSAFIQVSAPAIICPNFFGIEVTESNDEVKLVVSASENWHNFVLYCLEKGYHGLENLALIPGSVGASPVQNIGAYGTEVSDVISRVHWYDFKQKEIVYYAAADCQFSYRDSLFKQALLGQGLIVAVEFILSKNWRPKLTYAGLSELQEPVTAKQVVNKVIEIRQSKLPDPNELSNAGSFFKNPIISQSRAEQLKQQFPQMPVYSVQDQERVKVAAGWLIEQSGLKGIEENGVGVHHHQALVLVNYHQKNGQYLLKLAKKVQDAVNEKFAICLEPEVRLIDDKGIIPSLETN